MMKHCALLILMYGTNLLKKGKLSLLHLQDSAESGKYFPIIFKVYKVEMLSMFLVRDYVSKTKYGVCKVNQGCHDKRKS